jgi:two-component system sensor histidine kinase/response regulator
MDTLRILVVDDEPGMRRGVARALQDFRVRLPDINGEVLFAVDQADSGERALEMIAVAPPDIVLLDHKLPGISGLDVLDRIAEPQRDILTVMITAYASLETAVSATKRGAYDFLAKPFTPEELKTTIRKASIHLIVQRQARKLAQEKRQLRFEFISVLAHELKAPLGAIEGYLHILKDRSAGSEPAVYERMIERSLIRAEGMRKMIMDLLDLTRIESGRKKRELADVDVREVAQAAIETVRPDAMKRNISIDLRVDERAIVTADRGEIEIILNNLVSNAVKYNRDGGRVDVSVTNSAETLTITVADTGIGMSPEEAAKLFGDFVRIKNAKTRNILGSGLGLSIVKKLATMYGGDASVTSEPDKGSTFTVTLQAHSHSQAQTESNAAHGNT